MKVEVFETKHFDMKVEFCEKWYATIHGVRMRRERVLTFCFERDGCVLS